MRHLIYVGIMAIVAALTAGAALATDDVEETKSKIRWHHLSVHVDYWGGGGGGIGINDSIPELPPTESPRWQQCRCISIAQDVHLEPMATPGYGIRVTFKLP